MGRGIRTDLSGRGHYYYHGIPTQHQPNEIYFLDNVLTLNKFKTIIEIGTHYGGLTYLFSCHINAQKTYVYTIDIAHKLSNEVTHALEKNWSYVLTEDCFSKEALKLIHMWIRVGEKTLVYCDGGNKINEFNYFATLLKPNDVIMAHDRGHEIRIENIEHTVKNNNLVPIYEKEIKKLKCRIFAFRKENP